MSFSSPLAWYWVAAPLAVAVLALVLLLRGLFHVARGRFLHGGLHAGGATALALAALCAGLLVLNTQTYSRLTFERGVADVMVAAVDPGAGLYRVTVARLDRTHTTAACMIRGDEWLMSARVQKWKPWANMLGLDATYSLDQVANKYFTAARGDGQSITACDLAGPAPDADRWLPGLAAWLMAHAYAEQRDFGSAVYMPLADGAIYRVTMTQSGLNAEAVNPIAERALRKGI